MRELQNSWSAGCSLPLFSAKLFANPLLCATHSSQKHFLITPQNHTTFQRQQTFKVTQQRCRTRVYYCFTKHIRSWAAIFPQNPKFVFWTNCAFPFNCGSFQPIYRNKNQKPKWKLWRLFGFLGSLSYQISNSYIDIAKTEGNDSQQF